MGQHLIRHDRGVERAPPERGKRVRKPEQGVDGRTHDITRSPGYFLGPTLFDRAGRYLQLTEAGERLMPPQGGTNVYPNRRLPASGNSMTTLLEATPLHDFRTPANRARLVELLKQPQYTPFAVEDEIVSIWAGTQGKLDDVFRQQTDRRDACLIDRILTVGGFTLLARLADDMLTTMYEAPGLGLAAPV